MKDMYCTLQNIFFEYDNTPVLNNINMKIKQGEIVSIVGPSGAGKTTLLKILTGLLEPTSGNITYNPTPSLDKPRIIVFQDYLLFPHMNVYENIAFGLKARKMDKYEIERKVLKFLSYFNILDKKNSLPGELSAGQKQRVAIARSMVLEPAMLLLDEPFANLDYNLKAETAQFIRKTQKDFNVTTISVTHDQREAFTMSDKIGVLLNGELVEYDKTEEIYKNSKNIKAAEFLGHVNKIEESAYHCFHYKIKLPSRLAYVRSKDLTITSALYGKNKVLSKQYNGEYINYSVKYDDSICIVSSFSNTININDLVNIEIENSLNKEHL